MTLERAGYRKALNRLSRETVDQLLATLRKQHLKIEPIPPEILGRSSLGPKITEELTRLPIYLARGVRSWSGLVVCFPGKREELTTEYFGTPYLRRILYPMLELHRRLRHAGVENPQCIYILGERFPDVFLRKFRLLDQVIPHVIVLTGDLLKSMRALPPIPESRNEAWVQSMLCREMKEPQGLAVPYRGAEARLGFIAAELPTGEGTKNPERLDMLSYDKSDHSLVAFEIKGPDANRVEIENLFLQGLEHRIWLEYNKMAVKLMFDGVRGRKINTRKRVRLILGFFADRVPPLFHDLRDEAMGKDRYLSIELARLDILKTGGMKVVTFDGHPSSR